ncbi:MAG: hypothetical protein ACXW2G_05530 [Burkholderiaceae bacterium]
MVVYSMPMVPPAAVVLLDSVTEVTTAHKDCFVVTGSHGGQSAGRYALAVSARLYVFNDAGIGKDEAGIAALAMLDAAGRPAVAVAHSSARIGEAADTWSGGVISRTNAAAAALGFRDGAMLRNAIEERLS